MFKMWRLTPEEIDLRQKMTPRQRHFDEEQRLKQRTKLTLLAFVGVGLLVALAHGGTVSTTVRTASVAAFGAALGVGAVLGFLFGVPSKPQVNIGTMAVGAGDHSTTTVTDSGVNQAGPVIQGNPAPPPPTDTPPAPAPPVSGDGTPAPDQAAVAQTPDAAALNAAAPQPPPAAPAAPVVPAVAAAPDAAANPAPPDGSGASKTTVPAPSGQDHVSNLEQVADWVTKLLLGGGLTQMQRIPPKIWQWAHVVAVGIIGEGPTSEQIITANQAFAAGLMVYGFILGFFAGFLITKLELGKALSDV